MRPEQKLQYKPIPNHVAAPYYRHRFTLWIRPLQESVKQRFSDFQLPASPARAAPSRGGQQQSPAQTGLTDGLASVNPTSETRMSFELNKYIHNIYGSGEGKKKPTKTKLHFPSGGDIYMYLPLYINTYNGTLSCLLC